MTKEQEAELKRLLDHPDLEGEYRKVEREWVKSGLDIVRGTTEALLEIDLGGASVPVGQLAGGVFYLNTADDWTEALRSMRCPGAAMMQVIEELAVTEDDRAFTLDAGPDRPCVLGAYDCDEDGNRKALAIMLMAKKMVLKEYLEEGR